MKKHLNWSDSKKQFVYGVISSVLTLLVLVFALLTLESSLYHDIFSAIYFGFTFIALSFSKLVLAFPGRNKKFSLPFIKNLVFAVIYLGLAIVVFSIPPSLMLVCISCSIYFLSVAVNRICRIIENPKIISRICNALIAGVNILIGVTILTLMDAEEATALIVTICLIVILILALIDILTFVFSRMKLKGIMRIMRKTYAFEILYGLLVLIIASSFYFAVMEPSVATFGDGLWYSFAIVTTIGFGDIVVTGIISRILSVMLGIYGLVAVAVFTSVIINFYNEVKDKPDKKDPQIEEKKEEDSSEDAK